MSTNTKWIGLLGSCVLCSQPLEAPPPCFWGVSWGLGGVHVWARPAVGLRYRQTFFHCSPIPPYLSLGASQQIGFFQRKERTDRPIYAAIHFHQRYLATQELRQDKRLVGLLGIRVWLEPYLQRFYFQGGFGLQVQKLSPGRWRILPTAEAHLGGFYRPHTYKPKRFRRKGA